MANGQLRKPPFSPHQQEVEEKAQKSQPLIGRKVTEPGLGYCPGVWGPVSGDNSAPKEAGHTPGPPPLSLHSGWEWREAAQLDRGQEAEPRPERSRITGGIEVGMSHFLHP